MSGSPRSLPALVDRHPGLARILPFGLLLLGIAFDAPLKDRLGALPWDPRWDYAVRSLCALLALVWLWPRLPELRWRPVPGASAWLLAGGLGLAVFALWIAPPLRAFAQSAGGFDARWLRLAAPGQGGSGFTPLDAHGQLQWGLTAARLAGSLLVVPVAEELFWRSFLMRWIENTDFLARDPRQIGLRAWALQALLFGVEHELWLAGIVAGLAYGWLYRRSGRIWLPIAAHALTNGLLGLWVLQGAHWSYW